MVLPRRRQPSRKGSVADVPEDLMTQIRRLEELFTVDAAKLKQITNHFVSELEKGLSVEGGSIPMNPTWVMGYPDGNEQGTFLALDMGGTNLRVCEVILLEEKGEYDIIQSKYRMPEELKTGESEEMWEYIADCIQQFIEYHHEIENLAEMDKIPIGFTFSFPATQNYIDHGILQRWTKGFDIKGVEGEDVVPMFNAALTKRKLPVKLSALINDTTGTLIASHYTNSAMQIGCIFGTGCNAAYMENCGSVPKIASHKLPADMPIAINCEYGAFDNEHVVLPRTPYDVIVDQDSPRPGQQAFEKMIAGLYLGEIFRLVLVDLHDKQSCSFLAGQDISALRKAYSLDASFLSDIETDPFENLTETADMFKHDLGITASKPELELCRRLAELIGTRAARLSACGPAAICKKKDIKTCHVGADGSVFNKYPHFKQRGAQALAEIFDWEGAHPQTTSPTTPTAPASGTAGGTSTSTGGTSPTESRGLPKRRTSSQGSSSTKSGFLRRKKPDPIEILGAEDGSGVGAALIAALTIKRVAEGNLAGIKNRDAFQ